MKTQGRTGYCRLHRTETEQAAMPQNPIVEFIASALLDSPQKPSPDPLEVQLYFSTDDRFIHVSTPSLHTSSRQQHSGSSDVPRLLLSNSLVPSPSLSNFGSVGLSPSPQLMCPSPGILNRDVSKLCNEFLKPHDDEPTSPTPSDQSGHSTNSADSCDPEAAPSNADLFAPTRQVSRGSDRSFCCLSASTPDDHAAEKFWQDEDRYNAKRRKTNRLDKWRPPALGSSTVSTVVSSAVLSKASTVEAQPTPPDSMEHAAQLAEESKGGAVDDWDEVRRLVLLAKRQARAKKKMDVVCANGH